MLKKLLLFCLILSMSLFSLYGCKESTGIGSEKIVEQSQSNKPNWLNNPPATDSEFIYFVGETESASSSGVRDAYQVSVAKITQYLETVASQAYESIEKSFGKQRSKTMSEQLIQNISKKNIIRGAKEKSNYWQKMEVTTQQGVTYYYRVYSLVMYPKTFVKQAVEGSINNQIKEAQANNDKELQVSLEQTRAKLLAEINK